MEWFLNQKQSSSITEANFGFGLSITGTPENVLQVLEFVNGGKL
jgi:hypothetical protein